MKDTYYFSHDYNARNDHKIKKIISKHGYLGYGLFWAIIEDLYNNANALQMDYESIAFDLRTSENIIDSIINDFDLFVIEGDNFGSLSVQRRLEERDAKSQKARETAFKRWNKNKDDANAMQTHSEGNAIKERKVNEIKEKENKVNDINCLFESFVESEKWVELWGRWKKYKKEQHNDKYKSEDSEITGVKKLLSYSQNNYILALQIIEDSIGNSYKGFFKIKETKSANSDRKVLTD